ncbi:MAG TPA: hypothetical protein VJU16_03545 [Planctomycetota bacterium]|nr:hypothetical protein [Planctomycetota bacterium]
MDKRGKGVSHIYEGHVFAEVGDYEARIFECRRERDKDIPYETLLPLVTKLAKGLGVEWAWENYDE